MNKNLFKSQSLFYIFLILIFFPWVQIPFFKNTLGIQPYSVLFSILLILLSLRYSIFNKHILIFFLIFFLVFILGEYNFNSLRSLFSYTSFCVVFLVAINFFKYQKKISLDCLINSVVLVYIICGLLQIFHDPNLFSHLSNRSHGFNQSMGRGVESLAVEPTFLGFHSLFIFVFYFLYNNLNNKIYLQTLKTFCVNKKLLIFLLLILLFYISRSSSAIISLLTVIIIYSFLNFNIKVLFIISSPIIFFYFVGEDNIRFIFFLKNIFNIENIFNDLSVVDRLSNIYNSFAFGLIEPFGNGYNIFFNTNFDSLSLSEKSATNRISSFFGTITFELGIFAFIYFFIVFIFNPVSKIDGNIKKVFYIFFIIVLLQSIPISYPLLPTILAMFISGKF